MIRQDDSVSDDEPHNSTYEDECSYIENRDPTSYVIKIGFVSNMRVPGIFYVNKFLAGLTFEELKQHSERGRSAIFTRGETNRERRVVTRDCRDRLPYRTCTLGTGLPLGI